MPKYPDKPKDSKVIDIVETMVVWFIPTIIAASVIVTLAWVLFDVRLI